VSVRLRPGVQHHIKPTELAKPIDSADTAQGGERQASLANPEERAEQLTAG
jgi:hypothetical protein